MRQLDDPYGVLGVERDASAEECKAAYRRLVRSLHPDAGGPRVLFEVVHEAYALLSDPHLRAAFDDRRVLSVPESQPAVSADAARGPRPALWTKRPGEERLIEGIIAGQLTIAGLSILTLLLR